MIDRIMLCIGIWALILGIGLAFYTDWGSV